MQESSDTLTQSTASFAEKPHTGTSAHWALGVMWCAGEARVGEVVSLPPVGPNGCFVLGRGEASPEDDAVRLIPVLQRPGHRQRRSPFSNPRLSRRQLVLRPSEDGIQLENAGRCKLFVNGTQTSSALLRPGDLLRLGDELLLLCLRRPSELPPLRYYPSEGLPYAGEADAYGIVGEGPVAWQLRERLAFAAQREGHVLVVGESGTGKELAAHAIHRLSARKNKVFVARNAATIPATLIDAELFGNTANYPNSGMPARPGLIGAADGSTLFLDEIGELPEQLQTHLLRFLDDQGEYHRLGEATLRRADIRFVAATNRPLSDLRPDLLARLRLRIEVPSLSRRVEDIPLIARHLLKRAAARDPDIEARFIARGQRAGEPLIGVHLMEALVRHVYSLNVRELDVLLWRSIETSQGDKLELTAAVEADLAEARAKPLGARSKVEAVEAADVAPEQIRACLERHRGAQEPAWRELGLRNRYVLKRLIKKHGLGTATANAKPPEANGQKKM